VTFKLALENGHRLRTTRGIPFHHSLNAELNGDNAYSKERKFCVNVNLYIKPEFRQEFIEVIKNNQKGTLASEARAIMYTWGESTKEKNVFHFQEQYYGEDGFLDHQKTSHFRVWEEFANKLENPFSKPPEVFLFEEM
jgi:quinol monooxygenase YgiN